MKYFSIIFVLVFAFVSTSFAQINWAKDANNPVMSGGAAGTWNRHVLMPSVLYNPDSARYEMWFGTSYGSPNWHPYRIGFAVSDDGINWTALDTAVLNPDPGEWDESTVEGQAVIRENGQYKMWYTGWRGLDPSGIGYATSPDGITWTKDSLNPIMGPGTAAWEAGGPLYCTVMPVPGEGYKMWYNGTTQQYDSLAIGYAESVNGITWERDTLNNPVLTTGSPGEWDDHAVGEPRVIFIDGIYYMMYTGFLDELHRKIGLATSSNGIHWTKYDDPNTTDPPYAESDPVLYPGPNSWDGSLIETGTVMLIGSTLHMWYNGSGGPVTTFTWKIGHATSPIVGIEPLPDVGIPQSYALEQNYPNPFNPTTNIEFSIPKSVFVTLKVYNILGEEVATLVSERLTSGTYKYDWDARSMASGVYLYRIQAGTFQQIKKMILIK